ncbi:exocyst complex component EXO84B [Physcomitrium patens]|uniref:exocyst complex component EXO84B n=1 Tax=Physcomitrium patens TaxID=3218 RepID=UPI003CCCAFDF
MGSVKPSVRHRGAGVQSNVSQSVGSNGSAPGAPVSNGYVNHLRSELSVFEKEEFDAQAYVQSKCQSMSEKGIRKLCDDLLDLKKSSAEEMRKSVYANYAAFIRTSREISDLEGELVAMRNLLNSQAALVRGLAESVTSKTSNDSSGTVAKEKDLPQHEPEPSQLERRAQDIPDILDVLLAERKVNQALQILEEGDMLVSEGFQPTGYEGGISTVAASKLQAALSERRARLAEQLAEAIQQPFFRGSELRSAIGALDKLGDGTRAHTLLLHSHHKRLQHNVRGLRPSGTSYGGAYTAALSQLVFSGIAQASRDSVAVFGEEPAYASELVLWARSETELFASLVKRHVLSSSAAAGGLRAAAECVQIALGHCQLLEDQGLALCPVLSKLVRPSVEQALEANLTRIEESVAALAAADDWVLSHPGAMLRGSYGMRSSYGTGHGSYLKLSSSAHRFNFMVQDFLEDVAPLISMQLGGPTLDGLSMLFDSYVDMLMKAVPSPGEDEEGGAENGGDRKVRPAATESQQLALLGNASALADELLPRAASKLVPGGMQTVLSRDDLRSAPRRGRDRDQERNQFGTTANRLPELKDWRRRLQRGVDRLRDHLCRQHVLELIYFSDEPDSQLSPETYLNLDNDGGNPNWHQEPMPSPILQALFHKLTSIQHTAADLLSGRERVVVVLLMRLTETLVICLSEDQDFWDAIEDGEISLGPIGLQQFVLDMQFVIQVAINGRFSSRHMRQVVNDVTARAVTAFAATGGDPHSVLQEDEWFLNAAQEAVRVLLEDWNTQVGSPTASISAQSVSSFRSHGSE